MQYIVCINFIDLLLVIERKGVSSKCCLIHVENKRNIPPSLKNIGNTVVLTQIAVVENETKAQRKITGTYYKREDIRLLVPILKISPPTVSM